MSGLDDERIGGCEERAALVLAVTIVVVIALSFAIAAWGRRERMLVSPSAVFGADAGTSERRSVHAALNRLYSTADVDPLITGQLYQGADYVRNVYAQRTSHGDVHGLTEYGSGGGPGDVGVDVGPYGLEEYGGRQIGYDDGIPPNWALPSTPVRWYSPAKRDYYGPEGPTVYAEGLYSLSEPDHDPVVN